MRTFRYLFLLITCGILVSAKAQTPGPVTPPKKKSESGIPLFFPAEKNNIQILPQRFEYNLVDEDHIKIGDILIDSTTFGFQIAASVNFPGKFRAKFIWPAGLLKDGSLLLKDNAGKVVWTTNFNRKSIRLVNPPGAEKGQELDKGVRTQLAEVVIDQLSPTLIEDMKYFPFMNFCISRANQDTRVYLCSKELYLTSKDDRLTIKARSQGKRTPFVEINGKSVGNQGIIFLNNENESIGFRAMTQTGATLEIETRMNPVDFKDAVLSEDKSEIVLSASGAEPVNEDKVKRISEDVWQFNLDASRPILYLKGEGNIPMRQEFYVKGATPSDFLRPSLEKNSFDRIYRSEIRLEGTSAPNTSISSNAPNEKVEKIGANKFIWHLADIPSGETSRHSLRVSHDQDSFVAAYDIFRDFPFEAGLLGSYWTPAGQFYANIYAKWWIENFLGRDTPWSRLHWGVSFKESLLLTKKDGEANINITQLELLWRANPGFYFKDKTWGLSLPYEIIQAPGVNASSFGLGIFYSDKAQKNYQKYLHWYELKFNYLVGGTGGAINLKSVLQFETMAYYHVTTRLSWKYGLGVNHYNFDMGPAKMQIEALGGANYRF